MEVDKVNIIYRDTDENHRVSNEEQLDIAKNVGNIVSNCMHKFMLESREKLQELVTGDLSADRQMEKLRETVDQYLLFCPDELRKYLEGFRYQEVEDVVNFRMYYQIWLNLHDCYGEKLIEIIDFYEEKFAGEMEADEAA